ncbi:MAG: hypothetical protein GY816_15780 [Cytophagales bacterium]|nr:hypothetical protein [Cytophagales bacterium]
MLFNEHGVLKDENIMSPPDLKYWGEFRALSNYIVVREYKNEGYYKGQIVASDEIKIGGLELIKQV